MVIDGKSMLSRACSPDTFSFLSVTGCFQRMTEAEAVRSIRGKVVMKGVFQKTGVVPAIDRNGWKTNIIQATKTVKCINIPRVNRDTAPKYPVINRRRINGIKGLETQKFDVSISVETITVSSGTVNLGKSVG